MAAATIVQLETAKPITTIEKEAESGQLTKWFSLLLLALAGCKW
jgi:hypothetical protein